MKLSPLNNLYASMLSFCGVKVDSDGKTYWVHPDDSLSEKERMMPFKVNEKQLVLPTENNLTYFEPENFIIFHPLIEQLNRGESDILKKIRHMLNVKLNLSTAMLMSHLMAIVASPKLHAKLSPEQRELLLNCPEISQEMLNNFSKFFGKNVETFGSRFFTNVYLKKGGTYKGEKHSCVGIVQFPLKTLLDDDEIAKSVKKKDREAMLATLKFIFPDMDDPEAYNEFSDSRDSSRLEAMLKTGSALASRINSLADLYAKCSHMAESNSEELEKEINEIKFDLSWEDHYKGLESLRKEIRSIPVQRGNDGKFNEPDEEPPTQVAPRQEVQRQAEPVRRPPVPEQRNEVPEEQDNTVTFRRISPIQRPQYPQYEMPQHQQLPPHLQHQQQLQQPVGNAGGFNYHYPIPGGNQHQQQQQPRINDRTSSGKLDFRAVVSTNPSVAMNAMSSSNPGMDIANQRAFEDWMRANGLVMGPNGQPVPAAMMVGGFPTAPGYGVPGMMTPNMGGYPVDMRAYPAGYYPSNLSPMPHGGVTGYNVDPRYGTSSAVTGSGYNIGGINPNGGGFTGFGIDAPSNNNFGMFNTPR